MEYAVPGVEHVDERLTVRGTPRPISSHSMLSGWKCNLNYSTQVQQPTEGRFLTAAVQMEQALTRGGAAMFTRSTPGCGIFGGHSLAWAASPLLKLRGSAGSLGLRLPNESGQLWGLVVTFEWYIHSKYMVYTWYNPHLNPDQNAA
jgi:hypothetical protein